MSELPDNEDVGVFVGIRVVVLSDPTCFGLTRPRSISRTELTSAITASTSPLILRTSLRFTTTHGLAPPPAVSNPPHNARPRPVAIVTGSSQRLGLAITLVPRAMGVMLSSEICPPSAPWKIWFSA